jgi:hypothetical protein
LAGAKSTWEGIKNQVTTLEGWAASVPLSPAFIANGINSGVSAVTGLIDIASNIPTYNANDYAYGAGFVAEKALEIILTKKATAMFGALAIRGGGKVFFRGGNSLEISAADIRNSIDKVTGLMKKRGISLNTNRIDPFVQKYGGAWQVNLKSIPNQLKIKLTSGTHYELVPRQAGMTLDNYLNLLKQVELLPYNNWP